jgi:nitroimidazol reductase NimA-like FMN-containing flavoprotein (pyridoxamine 5'-phosphate oxidase superfamily)
MTTVMTREAREQFLSDLHVGVLSVATGDGGTLTVPIWYDYTPDQGVRVITARISPKAAAIEATGRYSLAVQDEAIPYKYVSVEGPVTEIRPVDIEHDMLPLSIRYMGDELGPRYAEGWAPERDDFLVYIMRPERWASADMTEMFKDLRSSATTAVT